MEVVEKTLQDEEIEVEPLLFAGTMSESSTGGREEGETAAAMGGTRLSVTTTST